MKDYRDYFSGYLGAVDAIDNLCAWLGNENLPHALLLTAPEGSGKNLFAGHIAAAYLSDNAGLVARGVHPDCLTVSGEGASGNIPVARIRELGYALNLASVMTDGRRVAVLKNVRNLNRNSANALLKMVEDPPEGVLFLLTAASAWDILPTLISRCVEISLAAPTVAECIAMISARFPDYDADRIRSLCTLYGGKPGLVLKALSSPERLALCDAARRFCAAALAADKVGALSALSVGSRDDLRALLEDSLQILRMALNENNTPADRVAGLYHVIKTALDALGRYANERLVAANLVAGLRA